MSTKLVFLDIPSHLPDKRSGSPFTWAVRLSLNYKRIPYTTVWAMNDRLESVCRANGIPPSGTYVDGTTKYTFPAIIDAVDPFNTVRLANPRIIIEYLEKAYPNPPLNPNSERARAIEQYATEILGRPIIALTRERMIATFPPHVVNYFEEAAPRRWGISLQEAIQSSGAIGSRRREALLEEIREGFEGLRLKDGDKWLNGNEEPQYEDILILSWMMLIHVYGEDGWPKLRNWDNGKWKRYWEAAEEYLVVK